MNKVNKQMRLGASIFNHTLQSVRKINTPPRIVSKGYEKPLSEEEILKTSKHIKRGITSLIICELQSKMRYLSHLIRLA